MRSAFAPKPAHVRSSNSFTMLCNGLNFLLHGGKMSIVGYDFPSYLKLFLRKEDSGTPTLKMPGVEE